MINSAGAELITRSESIRLKAYKCPAGVWTIGRGHTNGVKDGDTITAEQEAVMFTKDMLDWERQIQLVLIRRPNDNQMAAFICFAFNVGMGAFKSSSVLKAFERGDDAAAARSFMLWDKATVNGKKVSLPGLTTRRAGEAALYLTPTDGERPEMPQAIAQEKPMAESSINRASVIAGGGATLAAVSESVKTVTQIKSSVDSLGDWVMPLLLVCVVAAIGYIVWERFQQRKEGRA